MPPVVKVKTVFRKTERKVISREEEGSDRPHPDASLLLQQSLISIHNNMCYCVFRPKPGNTESDVSC